uniref:CSON006092 protein n=1 Tax=Culicoides sonorensis TaxID=179676 RepID=A0A336L789_CULSO
MTSNTVPACLWLEKDTTPFELTILRPGHDKTETSYIPVRPYQNNICKHLRSKNENNMEAQQELLTKENYGCLSFIYGKTSCDFEDNRVIVQAIRKISETIVPFIVGIVDTNAECVENKPLIYSRIAYDIDWIRENMK